eukprot:1136754-Pelagomonas_calceolata.AAC.1
MPARQLGPEEHGIFIETCTHRELKGKGQTPVSAHESKTAEAREVPASKPVQAGTAKNLGGSSATIAIAKAMREPYARMACHASRFWDSPAALASFWGSPAAPGCTGADGGRQHHRLVELASAEGQKLQLHLPHGLPLFVTVTAFALVAATAFAWLWLHWVVTVTAFALVAAIAFAWLLWLQLVLGDHPGPVC